MSFITAGGLTSIPVWRYWQLGWSYHFNTTVIAVFTIFVCCFPLNSSCVLCTYCTKEKCNVFNSRSRTSFSNTTFYHQPTNSKLCKILLENQCLPLTALSQASLDLFKHTPLHEVCDPSLSTLQMHCTLIILHFPME